MKLADLTTQQKKALMKEMAQEQAQIKESRKVYKEKVNVVVPKLYKMLKELSGIITVAKKEVYDSLESLIEEKASVYQKEDEQQTHSFSNEDSSVTITVGYRVNDGWDDTVNVGVDKVRKFIETLGKNKDTRALTNTILGLLSNDAKGNLKASRVLQLSKLAEELNEPALMDAINIIKDAYKPVRTKQFVSVRIKNEQGEVVELPLSITDAHIIEK